MRYFSVPSLIVVTGLGAAAAFAAPNLILIGLFLGILPGIFLMFAPTICFYLCVYWFSTAALSSLGNRNAMLCGIAACAAFAFGIPFAANFTTERAIAQLKSTDLTGSSNIDPVNTIALLQPPYAYRSDDRDTSTCDNLCLTILYSGLAKNVVMGPSQGTLYGSEDGGYSAAYRIENKPRCTDLVIGGDRWHGDQSDSSPQILEAVRQRMAKGQCLTRIDHRTVKPDLTVKRTTAGGLVAQVPFSLRPAEIRTQILEIVDKGKVRARVGDYYARTLGSPLSLSPEVTEWGSKAGTSAAVGAPASSIRWRPCDRRRAGR